MWRGQREPRIPGCKAGVLMLIGLLSILLYGLKKCLPFPGNFFVLNRNHLVKVNSIASFSIIIVIFLVAKATRSTSKWLHVVPSTQLEIQSLELILYLGVVLARPRINLSIFCNVVQDVTLDR